MKKTLRARLLKTRDSIPPEQKARKDAAIMERLFALDLFKNAKGLLLYASFRSEVDTTRCLSETIRLGKRLILPAVDSRRRELILYEVKEISELKPGYMGIPEPAIRENRQVTLKDIDLIIVPGVGFDQECNRLGYGGGYYDRLLGGATGQRLRSGGRIAALALAFEEQITEKIPSEPHDVKVDMIITDKRVICCHVL
ncbi:MAG: 5-formyltetrahydrofolate cyclo-ligase [Deferribacteres bacterium]|nr:5-formyltetrahydrofolate cyclo-ligase [Deferribacteres bacterium]